MWAKCGPLIGDQAKVGIWRQSKKTGPLLYVGDWYTNDVFVFGGFPKHLQLITAGSDSVVSMGSSSGNKEIAASEAALRLPLSAARDKPTSP